MIESSGVSRRSVLAGVVGGAVTALAFDLSIGVGNAAAAAGDFAAGREQWRRFYIGADLDRSDPRIVSALAALASTARSAFSHLDIGPDRVGVFTDMPFTSRQTYTDSQRVSGSTKRLRSMALAWAAGALGSDADDMLAAIADALVYLTSDVYSPTGVRFGDWYDWDIAIPISINDAVVLVYDAIDPATAAAVVAAGKHFTPTIPTSGTFASAANRLWICDAFVGRGLLGNDATDVTAGRDGLTPVLDWAHPDPRPPGKIDPGKENEAFFSHDGFYPDGSFVQHAQFPYVGLYGTSYFTSLPVIAARTAGSDWQPDTSILFDWIWNAYEPWLWRAQVLDTVRGRVTDRLIGNREAGKAFLVGFINLMPGADAATRARLASLIKAELPYRGSEPTAGLSLADTAAAAAILADPAIRPRPPLTGTWVFGVMDRVLHRRPEWVAAFAMNSWRMANAEKGLTQNKRAWYQSDAATYLYTSDLEQYEDGYWATIDSYRLPGTTTDRVAREPYPGGWANEYHNPSYWAGGVTAGDWGAAGLDLTAEPPSSLHGRFTRFFFADGYVALGAGITVDDGRTAETTVENRRVTSVSTADLTVDGEPVDASATISDARWAHLAGVAGYVLLEPHDLTVVKETRSGRLIDISTALTNPDATVVRTHNYVTLVLPYGATTQPAGYAYAVLPGASAGTTAAQSSAPRYHVVKRTEAAQAVRDEPSGRTGFVLFAAASAAIVTTDTGCAVAVEELDDELVVHVSDPTHMATRIRLTLAAKVTGAITLDPRMTLATTADSATLTVDVTDLPGPTLTARLAWNPPTAEDLARAVARAAGACPGVKPDEERTAISLAKDVGRRARHGAIALRQLRTLLQQWAQRCPIPELDAAIDLASRMVARTT